MATRTTVKVRHHRFTVDDYYRMADAGILGEDDRVELIEGEIVEMPPVGSYHANVVDELSMLLVERLTRARAHVRVKNPVRLNDESEPQPDIVVAIPRPGGYRSVHPGPKEIALLVEVADTTLAFDRRVKLPLYARSGVSEVWIVDLQSDAVEVCRDPRGRNYDSHQLFTRGASFAPQAFPDVFFTINEILG